jgi:hypothetical protein
MINITFPSGDKRAASVFGTALLKYAGARSSEPQAEPQAAMVAPYGDDPAPTNDELSGYDATVGADNIAADIATNEAAVLAFVAQGDTTPDADAPLDHNGVAKDPRYCGDWSDPFYPSGKHKGAWKKKRGVSESDYAAWYAVAVCHQPSRTLSLLTLPARSRQLQRHHPHQLPLRRRRWRASL